MIVIMVPVRNDEFLMVYNPRRGWEFPGGKVENGEDPEEAVLRECMEEAGLVLRDLEVIEKTKDMVVFTGIIDNVKGGEMKWKMFSDLPDELSFSRDEAIHFLSLSSIYI